jgi:hypothetical protein
VWNKKGHKSPKQFCKARFKIETTGLQIQCKNKRSEQRYKRFFTPVWHRLGENVKNRKKQDNQKIYRKENNFKLYKDGIHPCPLHAQVWLKKKSLNTQTKIFGRNNQ